MGESKEDIVDMLLDLREIQPEALPINFLLPIPGTPLEHALLSVKEQCSYIVDILQKIADRRNIELKLIKK